MSVKGPRLHRMVVTAQRPGRRMALVTGLLLLAVGIAAAAFVAGRVQTLRALAADSGDNNTLASLETLLERNNSLRDELAVYRGGGDVAREVEERVRVENRGLQDRVAELEQALADYRRLVVVDSAGRGLGVERLEIARGAAPGTWLLRIVLVRLGETDSTVDGQINGRLLVDNIDGTTAVLDLAQLVSSDRREFHVRYVEERMIDLRLQPGQVPSRLDLDVTMESPKAGHVRQSWQKALPPRAGVPAPVPVSPARPARQPTAKPVSADAPETKTVVAPVESPAAQSSTVP